MSKRDRHLKQRLDELFSQAPEPAETQPAAPAAEPEAPSAEAAGPVELAAATALELPYLKDIRLDVFGDVLPEVNEVVHILCVTCSSINRNIFFIFFIDLEIYSFHFLTFKTQNLKFKLYYFRLLKVGFRRRRDTQTLPQTGSSPRIRGRSPGQPGRRSGGQESVTRAAWAMMAIGKVERTSTILFHVVFWLK
jgi:hypothetical protein